MFKLVVLSALLAVAAARPGVYESSPLVYTAPIVKEQVIAKQVYSAPIVQEQVLAKVGAVIKSVPSAVSHQSSTIVHNSAHVVEPIVAPIVKTYAAAPVIKTVHAPLVQTYAAAPLPLSAPAHYTYAAASPIAYHSAPVSYAAGW